MDDTADGVRKSDDEWRASLTATQFRVLREHGTEPAWSHPYNTEHRDGQYVCAGCGAPLFSAEAKFDSGSGWPSYFAVIDGAVDTTVDRSHGMVRTEMHCRRCGGHLGHLFDDGPAPTGLRYCTNGTSLRFVPRGPDPQDGLRQPERAPSRREGPAHPASRLDGKASFDNSRNR